jgi:hypothetical protein
VLAQMTGVEARRVAEGDVDVQVRSPFQMFPDPLAEALDECEFLIEEVVKSEEYVFAHYGSTSRRTRPPRPGVAQSRMSWTNNASVPGGSSGSYQGVKVRELWRLPCATTRTASTSCGPAAACSTTGRTRTASCLT